MTEEQITDERLLALNRQAILPGPGELEAAFLKRADYCLNLREEFASIFEDRLPFDQEEAGALSILEESNNLSLRHFGIAPTWVPLFFSNRQLPFWQGGCAWIFQKDETHPFSAFLQLRCELKGRSRFLGLYSREELVAHELAHVGRMVYEEPCFEELLAYRTASSSFRRFFGPLIKSARESSIFMFVLLTLLIADTYLLVAGASLAVFQTFFWLHLVPVSLILYALIRLLYVQHSYRKAENAVRSAGLSFDTTAAILYRLMDQEIFELSTQNGKTWLESNREKSLLSLRWRLIYLLVDADSLEF